MVNDLQLHNHRIIKSIINAAHIIREQTHVLYTRSIIMNRYHYQYPYYKPSEWEDLKEDMNSQEPVATFTFIIIPFTFTFIR